MTLTKKTNFKLITAALSFFMILGCASVGNKTKIGAGTGAAVGAAVGGIMGSKSGNAGEGALLGAALGAALGGSYGAYLDKQAKELAELAETRRTDQGMITRLKGDILFSTGKHKLNFNAQSNIDNIAAIIKKYPEDRIRVIGHTDSQGSDTTNANLSRERARSVYSRLVAGGVPANTIQIVGMGETSPVASNSTSNGRKQNRRVELEITVDKDAYAKKKKK